MKKRIKINFYGLPLNVCEEYYFVKILKERYEVEISDKPDYLFCGPLDRYGYCKFQGIRIFYAFECFHPDMNLFDYALSCTDMGENERHTRIFLPIYNEKNISGWNNVGNIESKTKFCNYIYSHGGIRERTEIFNVINQYKKVDSAGRWMNNMKGKTVGANNVDWDSKLAFQKKYKFSIAVENFSYPYYCTEKITDAFRAHTIPIYYGDPKIGEYFNEEAFVNLHNYNSFEDALDKIIEIDQNHDLFVKMLMAPKFNNKDFWNQEINRMKQFLYHIFDQDFETAFRRPDKFWPKKHEMQLNISDYLVNRKMNGNVFRDYFQYQLINRIAIYGQGEFYELIKEDILTSGVEIKCIIESNMPNKDVNQDGVPVIWAQNALFYQDVDAIVVMPCYVMDEIMIYLQEAKVMKRVISLEQIITCS